VTVTVRRESPGDLEAVRAVVDAAFPWPEGADRAAETGLVDGLRTDGDVLPDLTLVAEDDGEVVGQLLCSRAHLGSGTAVAVGPVAVRPDRQGRGIGSALVRALITAAERTDAPCLVLLGDPDLYGRFGFEPAARHGIGSPGPWPDRFFQVRTLPAWDPALAGPFRYAVAFDRL